MSKFNTPSVTHKTTNLAGGTAYKSSAELTLVSAILTSFLEDKFYQSGKDRTAAIVTAVKAVDPKFAAQAALFARNEFGMRSTSHVVAAELAQSAAGKPWATSFYNKIVHRPDDMLEILAYYKKVNKKVQTHAMRKGFALALNRFDDYQLAKYRGAGKGVKLVDVANITHPQPTDALGKLIRDELRNQNTFEAKLSAAGKSEDVKEAKNQAWADLVNSGKIGYMALLKNLRNIIQDAPEVVPQACKLLVDVNRIRKSLVLPFRFVDAADEVAKLPGKEAKNVLIALSQAMDLSVTENVPSFDGDTLVAVDTSGSMGGKPIVRAALFAAMLSKKNLADIILWNDKAGYLNFNPQDSVLTIAKTVENGFRQFSGGTDIAAPFRGATKAYDRILILTDEQSWGHSSGAYYNYYGRSATTGPKELEAYRKKFNCTTFVYNWDLQGYGQLAFPEDRVATLAGWSDKVFDIMKLCETDKKALVNTIKALEF